MAEWDSSAAEWYAARYGEYATNRLALGPLEFPSGSVVVDVGCGTGHALRQVAARVAHATLIGIDPVPRMLEIARERTAASPYAGRIEFRPGRAARIPVEDGRAHFVFAFDTFDYWSSADAGLAEVARVLAPEGRFVALKDAGDPDAQGFTPGIPGGPVGVIAAPGGSAILARGGEPTVEDFVDLDADFMFSILSRCSSASWTAAHPVSTPASGGSGGWSWERGPGSMCARVGCGATTPCSSVCSTAWAGSRATASCMTAAWTCHGCAP
jgi:SAM-dependent methyltransferase